MAIRLLPEARDDLRDAIRYYRDIAPPALGRRLAARMFEAFKNALRAVEAMPLSRPEHADTRLDVGPPMPYGTSPNPYDVSRIPPSSGAFFGSSSVPVDAAFSSGATRSKMAMLVRAGSWRARYAIPSGLRL